MCANELLLRNAIIQKMVSGRNVVDSFRLPETVPRSGRIGEDPSTFPAAAVDLNSPQVLLPIVASAQESAPSAATPLDDSIAEIINVSPPGELPAEHS